MSFAFHQRLLQLLSLQIVLMAPPAVAAQEIFFNVSALEASVSVQALQNFGETGKAKGLLRKLLNQLSSEAQQQAQSLFATQLDVDPVRLSNFLYTPQGETLLRQFGQILQSESGHSGFAGLRAALYRAAQDPQGGLTVPNVLKHVPGDRIRLNTERLLELTSAWREISSAAQRAQPQPAKPIISDVLARFPLSQQLELQNPGQFDETITMELKTTSGDLATLYLPTGRPQIMGETAARDGLTAHPVIVISHGLGGDRTSFTYLAEYLVSHGFAVVVPEHQLASQQLRGQGKSAPLAQADQLFEDDWAKKMTPQDFVQRPRTVTRLLDELEKRQQHEPDWQVQLDLERVGVVGQSFGAYTGMVLGGAQVNLAELAQHCPADAITFNPSLALQCRALGLGEDETHFRDPRIKAIAAINPLGSAIFGPEEIANIEVPVLMMAGSHDFVTPPYAEQLQPFQWLTHPHRYLAWLQGGTHFSVIQTSQPEEGSRVSFQTASEQRQTKKLDQSPAKTPGEPRQASQHQRLGQTLMGQNHQQAKDYLKASSLAFFQTHLTGENRYAKFLTPEFAALLSQGQEMTLVLGQELSQGQQ